jgi:plasmid stabilization system protein ParE
MSYRILPTAGAEADIERLYASITERSGEELARRWYEAYTSAVERRLLKMPFSCGLAYENPAFPEELRHLLFWTHPKRKYRALFTVRGDEVVILAIRAPGEKPVKPDDIAG